MEYTKDLAIQQLRKLPRHLSNTCADLIIVRLLKSLDLKDVANAYRKAKKRLKPTQIISTSMENFSVSMENSIKKTPKYSDDINIMFSKRI